MTDRKLDWYNPRPDPRNADFPIRPMLERRAAVDRSRAKAWAGPYTRLDQGAEGACVGFGWTTELMSTPIRIRPANYGHATPNAMGFSIYQAAKRVDEWAGEAYDGTSVLAGAKVVDGAGFIEEYRWCQNIDDVIDTLITAGPIVIGIPWYSSMYNTDGDFIVRVAGRIVGGHCLCLTGHYPRIKGSGGRPVTRFRQSWGASFGDNGDGYFVDDDLNHLIFGTPTVRGEGEACVPLGRSYGGWHR